MFGMAAAHRMLIRQLRIQSLRRRMGEHAVSLGDVSAVLFGITAGIYFWASAVDSGQFASAGKVMLSALPLILGVQLLLGFIAFDIAAVPRRSIWRLLR